MQLMSPIVAVTVAHYTPQLAIFFSPGRFDPDQYNNRSELLVRVASLSIHGGG